MIPKDYVSVADRVDKYHKDHEADMSISTEFTLQGDVACFKAVVKTKKGTFTGSSFGRLGREKAFEKLETVAVGRALAFAGYETTSGIASREEMEEFEANTASSGNTAPNSIFPYKNDIPHSEWIKKENVTAFIEKLKTGELTASSKEEAVKLARKHYAVSKVMADLIMSEYSKHIL